MNTSTDLSPTPEEVRTRVLRMLATILERDPATITSAQHLRADLAMDSLSALEFLSTLSQEFSIDLEVEEAYGLTTLDEVVALVHGRVHAS